MRHLIPIILILFISCQSNQADKSPPETIPSDTATIADTVQQAENAIISERIDGPANIRDSVNGKLLFTLNDNVVVTTTEAEGKWLQVGLLADLTEEQMDSLRIRKGHKILMNGKEVGTAIEDIPLNSAMESTDGLQGELTGYTSISNIQPNTVVENAFTAILNASPNTLGEKSFSRFLKDFQFSNFEGLLPKFRGFEIDENWIDDPSPMLRLWILFEGEKFYGVFHSRPLKVIGATTVAVNQGFYFTTFSQDQKTNKEVVDAFNSYISKVD